MTYKSDCYYHYTSVAGALAIISSRTVWLTDYRFLNDRLELRQGLDSFLSKIPKEQQASFRRAFQWHDIQNHHCVFSLSRSPKILSQWRAYASDGAGIALGLNRAFLEYAGLSLVECKYEDHDKYAAELVVKHDGFIRAVYDASQLHRAENDFMGWVEAQCSSFYSVVEDLIALKNPAFAEELELRAVWCRKMGEVKMRSARDLIIPYVDAKIWPDDERASALAVVIPEIWLGPKSNDLNRLSIHALNIGMCMIHRHDCGYV
ncbi:MAG: DUF2971 domain-containing protein [Acidovorax sp.]|uniref:DUF2971 domain-containing protein n=1 Tax=Acidovorax sp. TaxID=1872122 RepID=UPI0025BA72A2|nr:DUF2971 domain-containing protein [Acidovorax sp.]MCE1192398.1 DUF2971 domain-containing protein [Acidovorax sp.]